MKIQMADKEEGRAAAPKGAYWEVISLTESAYAAALVGIPQSLNMRKRVK